MTTLLGEAFVEIRPELTKFAGELKDGVTGAVDKTETESTGAFNRLAGVGKAAFLGIAGAAVGFGAAAIDAALKGQESTAQLAQAVKNAGDNWEELEPRIDKTTESYAKFGYENDEVEGALARLVQTTGSTSTALDLLQTAANLAAARHMDLTMAAQLVGRVAEGNVTVLKRYGIQVTSTGDTARDAQAALALLNERFGGAAQAQAETYAGKLKAFKAETENLTERVGNALLPVLASLAGDLAGTVSFFENNQAAAVALGIVVGGPLVASMAAFIVQEGILVASKLSDFFTLAGVVILETAEKFGAAGRAVAAFATGTEAAIGPIYLAAAAIGLLTGAITLDSNKTKEAQGFAQSYVEQVKGSGDEVSVLKNRIGELTKARDQEYLATEKAAAAHGTWSEVSGKARAKYEDETKAIGILKDRVHDLTTQHQAATVAQQDLGAAQDQAGISTEDLAQKYGLSTEAVQKLASSLKIDLTKATDDQLVQLDAQASRLGVSSAQTLTLRDSLSKLTDETSDATAKTQAFKSALDILIGGNIDAEKAVVNFQDKVDGLSKKLKDNKLSLDATTQAGRDNITTIEDAVSAIRTHVEALQNQGASADALRGAFDGDTAALRNQLTQAGYTKAQVDQLIASYGLVPKNIETVIQADLDPAERALRQYAQDLAALGNAAASIKPGQTPVAVPRFGAGAYFPGGNPMLAVVGDSREVMLPLDDPKRMAEILAEAGVGRASTPAGGTVGVGAGAVQQTFVVGGDVTDDTLRRLSTVAKAATVEALEVLLGAHAALSPTAVPA